jgi:hypothetical protein
MPSHQTPPSGGERDVGEDRVLGQRGHRVRVGFDRSAGRDAEESRLGIDRAQTSVRIRPDPRDVIADRPHFPRRLLKRARRDHHGEIGFSAGAGERGGHVGFIALGILDAEDQHVLGHPALVARHVGWCRRCWSAAAVPRRVQPRLALAAELYRALVRAPPR